MGAAPPPWETLKASKYMFDISRDLHPWGCYMQSKLPREHPLVQENQTMADHALEGAFLGFDLLTPSAWMYSVKLGKAVRVTDWTFYDDQYPFLNPSVIITPRHLTAMMPSLLRCTKKTWKILTWTMNSGPKLLCNLQSTRQ